MDTSKFATKTDIKSLRTELKADIRDLKSDVKVIRRDSLKIEERLENVEDGIKDIKVILGKMSNTLDGFVGRVDDLTVDNEVGTHQTRELEVKVEDLDKRVTQIESSKQAA